MVRWHTQAVTDDETYLARKAELEQMATDVLHSHDVVDIRVEWYDAGTDHVLIAEGDGPEVNGAD